MNRLHLNKIRLNKVRFMVDFLNDDIYYVDYSGHNKHSLHWLCKDIREIKIISKSKEVNIGDYIDLDLCLFVCSSGNVYEVFGWH